MAEKRIEPGPLARQVAESIKRIRETRRIPYAELSERLAELGRPIPVLGLSRIERGDRRVDLDDMVAIAEALHVPPIWLLFPLGRGEPDVEVVPGVRVPAEGALAWFTGDIDALLDVFGRGDYHPDSGSYEWYEMPEGIDTTWSEDMRPLRLYRQHRQYVRDWYETWVRGPRAQETAGQPAGKVAFALAAQVEGSLRALRSEMRRLGLPLPDLPGGLRARIEAPREAPSGQEG